MAITIDTLKPSTLLTKLDTPLYKGPSLFKGHALQPINDAPVLNPIENFYWPSIIFFTILIIYISVKVVDQKKLYKVFASVFSLQESKQLYREDYRFNKRISIFLSIGFILSISFLAYNINDYFGLILTEVYSFKQYLFFVLLITLSYGIKIFINYLLSILTSKIELGKEYIFNVVVFYQTVAVFIFPIMLCIQYTKYPTEWFLYPGIIITAGFYAIRLIRGVVISVIEQNIGILYIFLYLCTLEILPFLVVIKFLLNNF